ncbi:MAG: hypothetical protein AAGA21_07680 [Pseudomonadota bacterium]
MLIGVQGQGLKGKGWNLTPPFSRHAVYSFTTKGNHIAGRMHFERVMRSRPIGMDVQLNIASIAPEPDRISGLHALAGADQPCLRQLIAYLFVVDPLAPVLIDKIPGRDKQSAEGANTDYRLP